MTFFIQFKTLHFYWFRFQQQQTTEIIVTHRHPNVNTLHVRRTYAYRKLARDRKVNRTANRTATETVCIYINYLWIREIFLCIALLWFCLWLSSAAIQQYCCEDGNNSTHTYKHTHTMEQNKNFAENSGKKVHTRRMHIIRVISIQQTYRLLQMWLGFG